MSSSVFLPATGCKLFFFVSIFLLSIFHRAVSLNVTTNIHNTGWIQANQKKTAAPLSTQHSVRAVPGKYPPLNRIGTPTSYEDADGDGFHSVSIDGSRSYSRYLDPSTNIIGAITEVIWKNTKTNKVISRKLKFNHYFPVGETTLSLTVIDSACNSHTAYTSVKVTPQLQQGMYCYFYRGNIGLPPNNKNQYLGNPVFSSQFSAVRLSSGSSPIRNRLYLSRCFFFIDITSYKGKNIKLSMSTFSTGASRLYLNFNQILSTNINNDDYKTTNLFIPSNIKTNRYTFELHYSFQTSNLRPQLNFKLNEFQPPKAKLLHDRKSIKPIIAVLAPASGVLAGGTTIKLTGYGLYPPSKVTFQFSTKSITVPTFSSDDMATETFVKTPKSDKSQNVRVYVSSSTGMKSNALQFKYSSFLCDGPSFTPTKITRNDNNQNVDMIERPTSVTLGPDNLLYMGTTEAIVNVIGYDLKTLKLTTYCKSDKIIDRSLKDDNNTVSPRSILGITFNPLHGNVILPYVSTSTANWWANDLVSRKNIGAWHNGAIDRLKSVKGNNLRSLKNGEICLKFDKRIVSGLPVANGGGHSVNAVLFTPNGDLLIAVGGNTNMGLPGSRLGNIWESPLSGAVIIAKLSRGNSFNGNIKYVNEDKIYMSKVVSPSKQNIDIYASGMRNIFTITQTIRGVIYGIDQGPGCPLGGPATSCSDFNKQRADNWDIFDNDQNWPSKVKGSEDLCPGIVREDKLIEITNNKFYGHPNLLRNQCKWIDPFTGKSADGKAAPPNYKAPMTLFPASATSVIEYSSAQFCSAMRGDLIVSTFRGVNTWRVNLNEVKKSSKNVQLLSKSGGIAVVEDIMGNLIFPRYTVRSIDVFKPVVSKWWTNNNNKVRVINVSPKWHRKSGNTWLFIGAYNLQQKNIQILVGKAKCTNIKVHSNGLQAQCTIPSRQAAGANLVDVKVTVNGKHDTFKNAVAFMNR